MTQTLYAHMNKKNKKQTNKEKKSGVGYVTHIVGPA
jgi:hypothetical protein